MTEGDLADLGRAQVTATAVTDAERAMRSGHQLLGLKKPSSPAPSSISASS